MPYDFISDLFGASSDAICCQKRTDISVKMFLPQNEGDSQLMFPETRNRPQIEMQTARDVEDAAHRELGALSTPLVGGIQCLGEFIWGAEG
jgi:hypothetical protein